jgi:saxitoxin biosynthesis operon SxtJ-like protein
MKPHGDDKQLRSFGLLVGGIFGAIGLWPAIIRGQQPRLWAVALGVALVVPALVAPRTLRPVYRVWMTAGEILNWINTRIILGVVFYGLLTPMGLAMRRFGHDPMRRQSQPGADTYRVMRPPRPGAHMRRQF